MATSMTTAPSFTMSAVIRPTRPTADTRMSACRVMAARSGVLEWQTVTVPSCWSSSMAMGLPTMLLRPSTHTPLSADGDAVLPQHLHDARRGAGQEHRVADHQPPHIVGVEAVHILIRCNGIQHGILVQMGRQGQLAQNTVYLRVPVQLFDQSQQRLLGGILRQSMLKTPEAALGAVPLFPVHIHPGGRVIPHQDHRQTGAGGTAAPPPRRPPP